jgi:hypothetical protein
MSSDLWQPRRWSDQSASVRQDPITHRARHGRGARASQLLEWAVQRLGCMMRRLLCSPCRGWLLVFLAVNVVVELPNNTNPQSRLATLCALVEDRTWRIDSYHAWTIDWARTPDSHYYSNKAPGPALLGYPVFWALDKLLTGRTEERADRDQARWQHSSFSLKALSILFQVLPFIILLSLALGWLQTQGVSRCALHVACVSMLFGNTAALFMNTYFGHAMAATCVLAICMALLHRRYEWVGLVYGFSLLSDYGAAVLLPGLLAAIFYQEPAQKWLRCGWCLAVGGALPGIVWVLYHRACFGGALTLPNHYQNPLFVDRSHCEILGLFTLLPRWDVVAELLFGFRRGLLWSQPWLLFVLVWAVAGRPSSLSGGEGHRHRSRPLQLFLIPGFLLLLWMNASFGEWHGGYSPGPRYMSLIFPSFGLLVGVVYDRFPRWGQLLLLSFLGVSVVFWLTVYATSLYVPPQGSMWGFTLGALAQEPNQGALLRLTILAALVEGQAVLAWRQCRSTERKS